MRYDERMTTYRIFLVASLFVFGCAESAREVTPPDPTASLCAEPLDLTFGSADSRTTLAGLSVDVDASCNIVLAGMTQGLIDFGGGPLGAADEPFAFVAKLDARGRHLWSRVLPVGAAFEGKDVLAVDKKGNIILAGSLYANVELGGGFLGGQYDDGATNHPFLLGLDADGHHVFSKLLAGNTFAQIDFAYTVRRTVQGVAVDGEGNFLISGEFMGTVDFGGETMTSQPFTVYDHHPVDNRRDVFLARYDPKGDLLWVTGSGGDTNDYSMGLDVLPSGEAFLFYDGYLSGMPDSEVYGLRLRKYAPDGDVLWERTLTNSNIGDFSAGAAATEDGGVVFGGEGQLAWSGVGLFGPVFVARLDSNGELTFGASVSAPVTAALPDDNGGIRAIGWFDQTLSVNGKALADASGGLDGFDMHVEWGDAANTATTLGGSGDEVAVAMDRFTEGDRVVVGVEGPLVHTHDYLTPSSQGTRIFLRRRR
jgi:hypothetical protein